MKGKSLVIFLLTFGLLTLLFSVDDVVIKTSTTSGSNSVSITNSDGTKTAIKATSDGNVLHKSDSYLNFGTAEGWSGYGVRDNGGKLAFKNSGNTSWSKMFPLTYAQITYTHGSGSFNTGTGYYTDQTTISLPDPGPYQNALNNCTGASATYYLSRSENLTFETSSGKPIGIAVADSGVYLVSANVAISGNASGSASAAVEFEIGLDGNPNDFDNGLDNYFYEALSCVVATTKDANDHASGAMTGYLTCVPGDIIRLGVRKLKGTETSYKVYAINLIVQRVK